MNFLKWMMDILFGWIPYVQKATWNLIKFDLTGSKPYRIRLVIFYLGLLWMALGYLSHSDGIREISTICPAYSELNEDVGMLGKWRDGRIMRLRLMRTDGTQINFDDEFTIYRVIKSEWFSEEKSVPVALKWFKLPTGRAWISELSINGKQVVSYDQRCKDLNELGRYHNKLFAIDFISLAIAFFMIILEARSLKHNYIRGK